MSEKEQTHGNILIVSRLFSFQGVWNSSVLLFFLLILDFLWGFFGVISY